MDKKNQDSYKIFEVRQDRVTNFRHVTELLSPEDGKLKERQILICHRMFVKNPELELKVILDEAERKFKVLKEHKKNEALLKKSQETDTSTQPNLFEIRKEK